MENDLLAKAEDLQLQNPRIPLEVMGNITGLSTQETTLSASSVFMESEIWPISHWAAPPPMLNKTDFWNRLMRLYDKYLDFCH